MIKDYYLKESIFIEIGVLFLSEEEETKFRFPKQSNCLFHEGSVEGSCQNWKKIIIHGQWHFA